MHEEWYTVPKETADAINKAKAEGRPIRDEKDKPVERLAGLAVFLMAVRFILIILFFPFFIIWKGVGAKKG